MELCHTSMHWTKTIIILHCSTSERAMISKQKCTVLWPLHWCPVSAVHCWRLARESQQVITASSLPPSTRVHPPKPFCPPDCPSQLPLGPVPHFRSPSSCLLSAKPLWGWWPGQCNAVLLWRYEEVDDIMMNTLLFSLLPIVISFYNLEIQLQSIKAPFAHYQIFLAD